MNSVDTDLGPLRAVELRRAKEQITGDDLLSELDIESLHLFFDRGQLVLLARGLDDTVSVTNGELGNRFSVVSVLSQNKPWNEAIGTEVREMWFLTTQHGYPDAVQLAFGVPGASECVRIQLEVAASRFRMFIVSPAGS